MRKLKTTIFLLLIVLPVFAFADDEISGSFQILQDGKVIGAERYSITFEEDGQVTTESQGTLKYDQSEIKDYTRLIMRSLSGPIHTYQREAYLNQVPKELAATYQGGELLIELNEAARKREKRLQVTPSTLIVDVGIWHHLHLLIHRYSHRVGGEQSFMIVIPSEMRVVEKVSVKHIGWEAVALSDGYFMAHRYFINRQDMGMTVWADKQGQILKIDVPLLNTVIETIKYDGERATEVEPVVSESSDLHREVVEVESGGDKLIGVVTRPKALEGRLPAIIYLSAHGPHDREGNVPMANVNVGTRELMDAISKKGFLVLRMDDRGVGESQGDIARNSLSVQALDTVAALEYLKGRNDVDPSRLALLGHGEGANVAIMVAAKRKDIKALVLLAPCDRPLSILAEEQIKHRLKLEGQTDPEAWKRNPVAVIMERARSHPDLNFTVIGGRAVYLDLYREWFTMTPVEDLKKSQAKVLHVQAGMDLQVFPHFADGFRQVFANESRYTYKLFPKLNHFFKPSRGTVAEYADPNLKVDPAFIEYVAGWLGANL